MKCHFPQLRQRRGPHRQLGVSLIEVMISLVLVSTILLVSLTASANLLRNDSQRRGANQGQATRRSTLG